MLLAEGQHVEYRVYYTAYKYTIGRAECAQSYGKISCRMRHRATYLTNTEKWFDGPELIRQVAW